MKSIGKIEFFLKEIIKSDNLPIVLSPMKCSKCRQRIACLESNSKMALMCVNGNCSNSYNYPEIIKTYEKMVNAS